MKIIPMYSNMVTIELKDGRVFELRETFTKRGLDLTEITYLDKILSGEIMKSKENKIDYVKEHYTHLKLNVEEYMKYPYFSESDLESMFHTLIKMCQNKRDIQEKDVIKTLTLLKDSLTYMLNNEVE